MMYETDWPGHPIDTDVILCDNGAQLPVTQLGSSSSSGTTLVAVLIVLLVVINY